MTAEIHANSTGMKSTQGAEYQLALNDPALAFDKPDEIVSCKNMTRAQKIQILTQWEYDVANLDGLSKLMRATHNAGIRTRIHNALNSIQESRIRGEIPATM